MGAGGEGVVACREFENLGKPTKSQSYVYSRRVLATLNTVSSKIPLPARVERSYCAPLGVLVASNHICPYQFLGSSLRVAITTQALKRLVV